MEFMNGKHTANMSPAALVSRIASYQAVMIDIGTGDGRYVEHLAKVHPSQFVIGIDACREQLHAASRRAPQNALFVIANALALPHELAGRATSLTVNFPWGSLLYGLVNGDPALLDGLCRITQPHGTLEMRLNAGALLEIGMSLTDGATLVRQGLRQHGLIVGPLQFMDATALRDYPTTWAKRLAFGPDPHALYLRARAPGNATIRMASPERDKVFPLSATDVANDAEHATSPA